MIDLSSPALWLALVIAASVAGLIWLSRTLYVTALPDQWLLRVNDGKLKDAGVGIARFRKPGDVVVRFTSTMQRVSFNIEALSRDRVHVVMDGFILWSVSAQGESPFKAYRKMGLTDMSDQPSDMRGRKHLLTTPQHRAFRKLVSAEVQRHAATLRLDDLLLRQDLLVQGVAERLSPLAQGLGIQIDQVEIVRTRPLDDEVMADLSCEQLEVVKEEAYRVRLEAAERTRQRKIESETRLSLEEANARRDRVAAEAIAALELEQRQAELLELQNVVERRRLEHERDQKLLSLNLDREVKVREQAVKAELDASREANEASLAEARRTRARADLEARLAALRAEAEAERDAAMSMTEADEAKSSEVRHHEIQRLQVEKITAALASIPIQDARWISVGDSPLSSLTGLIAGLQDTLSLGSGARRE